MRFHLRSLEISLRRGSVYLPFSDMSYYWGQMGAGKTSVVRLIDYCLGGSIELTPALQNEFVSAKLTLSLLLGDVTIERPRGSDRVIAVWGTGDESQQVQIPTREPSGPIIPGTGVEQLSDFLFWLSGISPPRVRKSKIRDDSDTARLSVRNLLWYCYLDQDKIDSSFFYVERDAPFYRRNSSRDVLRYILGFHDDRIAALESELDSLRGERSALTSTVAGLVRALKEVGVESELQIAERVRTLRTEAELIEAEINAARTHPAMAQQPSHAVDRLRGQARALGEEISIIEGAMRELRSIEERDLRHLHEMETLSLKYRRSISAKAVLTGVSFESCPRCAQRLPARSDNCCQVCGQPDLSDGEDPSEASLIEKDTKFRISELKELIGKHKSSLDEQQRRREELLATKTRVERERNEAMSRYDTAYLSTMLTREHERAALLQQAESVSALLRLPRMVDEQRTQIAKIESQEKSIRSELKEVRKEAESDDSNLDQLKKLFLDCLVRAGVPGIATDDRVEISAHDFFPSVYGPDPNDTVKTTFVTLSSGGKKTLFKCCFALAVHRLAAQLGAPLPEILIIDSPMKNISERENREHFEGFYQLVYQLKNEDLQSTQIILIDKEFSAPEEALKFSLAERHMRPGDSENPPLIPYYEGK